MITEDDLRGLPPETAQILRERIIARAAANLERAFPEEHEIVSQDIPQVPHIEGPLESLIGETVTVTTSDEGTIEATINGHEFLPGSRFYTGNNSIEDFISIDDIRDGQCLRVFVAAGTFFNGNLHAADHWYEAVSMLGGINVAGRIFPLDDLRVPGIRIAPDTPATERAVGRVRPIIPDEQADAADAAVAAYRAAVSRFPTEAERTAEAINGMMVVRVDPDCYMNGIKYREGAYLSCERTEGGYIIDGTLWHDHTALPHGVRIINQEQPVVNGRRVQPPGPPVTGTGAVEPRPKEMLGFIKTYNKQLADVTKLNDKFREYTQLKRAANLLESKGYPQPEIELPEYFSQISSQRVDEFVVSALFNQRIQEIYPDSGLYVQKDGVHTSARRNTRQFTHELILRYARKYCEAIAERDSTLEYEVKTDRFNNIIVRMSTAAWNLYDRDETGNLVSAQYPWLKEIIHQGMRLPVVVAEWRILGDRGLQTLNVGHVPSTIGEGYLVTNRHMSSHSCYGTVANAMSDMNRGLKRSIAMAYAGLISMNLFEGASFPDFGRRYYEFYNTVTEQRELIDVHAYRCKHCTDRDECIVIGGNDGCSIANANGGPADLADSNSEDTNTDSREDSVSS